jgi:FkbM family methyltransferase
MESPSCSFFLPSLDGGGAELVMLRLAEGFAKRGIKTDLVLANATGAYMSRLPAGVRVIDLGARPPVVISKTVGLGRYLRRERPEVLVAGLDIVSSSTMARALARSPTRVVMTVQTNLSRQFADKPRGAGIRRAFVRALYGRADRLVAGSAGSAADVAEMAGVPRERISVIHNPVVPPDLDALAAEAPDHPWLTDDGPPVVLGIGRLVRQKDFPTLVRAFGAVRREQPARLVILGSPDEREPDVPGALERLIDEEGVRGDVALPGFVDNPYAYLDRASVFALSSAYEGFGNVVAEALATGTPVVSTDCESGPAEILDGGRFGRLVPVGDHAALATAILETLEAPPDRELLRSRAQDFRVDTIVDRYLEVAGLASPSGTNEAAPVRRPTLRQRVHRRLRPIHRRGKDVRRQAFERLGSDRYSRPALFDMERKLVRHLPEIGGFFVEAGANDGFEQSNTYWLERFRGWRGVLVEGIPALAERCARLRPASTVVNCALVAPESEGELIPMAFGRLTSLVKGARGSPQEDLALLQETVFADEIYEVKVPGRTLSSVLDETGVGTIDLLSLDVEGYELEVLRGLDLERRAPRFILVEVFDEPGKRDAVDRLLAERYELVEMLSHHDLLYRLRP